MPLPGALWHRRSIARMFPDVFATILLDILAPILVLIAIGSVTGVSIAALFTGGLLPGVVLALILAIVARQRTGSPVSKPSVYPYD